MPEDCGEPARRAPREDAHRERQAPRRRRVGVDLPRLETGGRAHQAPTPQERTWTLFPLPRVYNRRLEDLGPAASYFDTDYFGWQGDSAERSARAVVPLVVERLHPASVVDVGCGSAAWLKVFGEHGVTDVVGVDGPYVQRDALRIDPDAFVAHDLAKPFELGRSFDLAISLEAAHYLSGERAPVLVESIAKLAPAVLFGAAVPHQTGGPGRNHQWPGWWAELFAAHGFRAADWLRPLVWEDERVDWWYAQNTILYLRDGGAGERILPLVHPGLAGELAHPGEEPRRRRRFGLRR